MSGKRPTDHLEPAAKKRGAARQLTKDDGSDADEEHAVVEAGAFKRADEATLKQRKIIKARRGPAGATPSAAANPFASVVLAPVAGGAPAPAAPAPAAAAANPFAAISLVPTSAPAAPIETKPATEAGAPTTGTSEVPAEEQPAEQKQDETTTADASDDKKEEEPAKPAAFSGGFGALGSSAGTGTGLAFGSGFGPSTGGGFGGFGSLASGTASSAFGASAGASTGFSFGSSSAPAFTFGASTAAGTAGGETGASVFGSTTATGTALFGAGKPAAPAVELPPESTVATGEEEEHTVFTGEGTLFEFDGAGSWKERGRGAMKVNVDQTTNQARVVMRQKGNLRLLLNANLWPEMQVTRMEGGKGATFPCINFAEPAPEGDKAKEGGSDADKPNGDKSPNTKVSTIAFRVKTPDVLEAFVEAVNSNKNREKKTDQ